MRQPRPRTAQSPDPASTVRQLPQPVAQSDEEQAFYCDFYKTLPEFEHHFDSMEFEVRKIASYWLAIIFACLAFIVRGGLDTRTTLASPGLLLCLVALFGNVGLFALWTLDQKVYHNLLNAAFRIGLQLERRYAAIPPIRSQMWANSNDSGVGRFQMLFYVFPMSVIALAGIFGAIRDSHRVATKAELLTIAVAAALVPLKIAEPTLKSLINATRKRRGGAEAMTEQELTEPNLNTEVRAVLERWKSTVPHVSSK